MDFYLISNVYSVVWKNFGYAETCSIDTCFVIADTNAGTILNSNKIVYSA